MADGSRDAGFGVPGATLVHPSRSPCWRHRALDQALLNLSLVAASFCSAVPGLCHELGPAHGLPARAWGYMARHGQYVQHPRTRHTFGGWAPPISLILLPYLGSTHEKLSTVRVPFDAAFMFVQVKRLREMEGASTVMMFGQDQPIPLPEAQLHV